MELSLVLDLRPETGIPLHRQIYEQIRRAILTGRVRSHSKVPASRQLAKSLNVSRTTVVQSYDQLIAEGYLETRQGAGTFVCAHRPDTLLHAELHAELHTDRKLVADNATLPQPSEPLDNSNTLGSRSLAPQAITLSAYGLHLQNTPERLYEQDCALSFRYGIPDLNRFPKPLWRRLLNRNQLADTTWMDYSPDPLGYAPLREQIARYIAQVRAVRCTPEQILITQGTQQSLGIIVRLLVNPGEAIAVENPGYLSGQRVFRANGAQLQPIPVDSEGLIIEGPNGLRTISAQTEGSTGRSSTTRLVYVTPSHQFPTGVLMSLSRRLALLQWAQQTNALIIEDDYDSEFRYSGRPIPALQGLEIPCQHDCQAPYPTDSRVIYVGTFSKLLFPGLQIGYVVVPTSLIRVFRQAKWLCDRQCSLSHQAALTDFIREGELARHVRRMRPIYGQRRQTLVTALRNSGKNQDATVEILGDEAGLHIMVRRLKSKSSQPNRSLIKQARARGVSLFSAQPHYLRSPHPSPHPLQTDQHDDSQLIFGFGAIEETDIKRAITQIQDLL